jgi:hypothetical protein
MNKKSRQNTRDAHGLKPGGRFALIPDEVMSSEAFIALPASAIRLLLNAAVKYFGSNNGNISLTHSELKMRGFSSNDTLQRALKKLLERGFLIKTKQGGFANGGKLKSRYALGWLPIHEGSDSEAQKGNVAWKSWTKKKDSTASTDLVAPSQQPYLAPIDVRTFETNSCPPDPTSTCSPDTSYDSYPKGHPHMGGDGSTGPRVNSCNPVEPILSPQVCAACDGEGCRWCDTELRQARMPQKPNAPPGA